MTSNYFRVLKARFRTDRDCQMRDVFSCHCMECGGNQTSFVGLTLNRYPDKGAGSQLADRVEMVVRCVNCGHYSGWVTDVLKWPSTDMDGVPPSADVITEITEQKRKRTKGK